jgi:hypothetical protein
LTGGDASPEDRYTWIPRIEVCLPPAVRPFVGRLETAFGRFQAETMRSDARGYDDSVLGVGVISVIMLIDEVTSHAHLGHVAVVHEEGVVRVGSLHRRLSQKS